MTDADRLDAFAAAALTGLVARGLTTTAAVVAYDIAGAMMVERARRGAILKWKTENPATDAKP